MNEAHTGVANNPLHGVKLQEILETLVDHYGWRELYNYVEVRCFYIDPSISSSLKFLRKTPWARKKIENMYVDLKSK